MKDEDPRRELDGCEWSAERSPLGQSSEFSMWLGAGDRPSYFEADYERLRQCQWDPVHR